VKVYIFPINEQMKVGGLITLEDVPISSTMIPRPDFYMHPREPFLYNLEIDTPVIMPARYSSVVIVQQSIMTQVGIPSFDVNWFPFCETLRPSSPIILAQIGVVDKRFKEFYGQDRIVRFVSGLHTKEPVITDFDSIKKLTGG
jgi:hypothetical protein